MSLRKKLTKMLLLLIIGVFSIGTFNSKPAAAAGSEEPYVGQISLFAFDFAPKGWVECKGQTLMIQQNNALYSLIGNKFGGNGTTTFALPNLQNASPIPNAKYYIALSGLYPPRDGSGATASTGSIVLFPYSFVPGGWASCDGAIMSKSNNQELFELLGKSYGGDGVNTFALPNLQNASPMKNDIKYCICVTGEHPILDFGPSSYEYIGCIDLYAFKFLSSASVVAECRGQTIQIPSNNALFALINTTYGGDGTNNFAIPDLRGAVPSPNCGYYINTNGTFPSKN